jgi:hypothetical protein
MNSIVYTLSSQRRAGAFLLTVITFMAILCWLPLRPPMDGRLAWIVRLYVFVLLILFLFGQLGNDITEGASFLPLILLTAPWSFLVPLIPISELKQFADSAYGVFVLLPVVSGGINAFILFRLLRRQELHSLDATTRSRSRFSKLVHRLNWRL